MTTDGIKSELQQMIQHENDVSVLEAIRVILRKTSLNPLLKEKLSSRALLSEQHIKAGKILTKEQIIERTNR